MQPQIPDSHTAPKNVLGLWQRWLRGSLFSLEQSVALSQQVWVCHSLCRSVVLNSGAGPDPAAGECEV